MIESSEDVTACLQVCGERVDVRADDPAFLIDVAICEALLQHVFSLLGPRAVEKTTAGLCRIDKREIDGRPARKEHALVNSA